MLAALERLLLFRELAVRPEQQVHAEHRAHDDHAERDHDQDSGVLREHESPPFAAYTSACFRVKVRVPATKTARRVDAAPGRVNEIRKPNAGFDRIG